MLKMFVARSRSVESKDVDSDSPLRVEDVDVDVDCGDFPDKMSMISGS